MRSRAQWVAGLSLFLAVTGCFGQSTAAPPAARQTALALEQQGRIAEAEAAWQAILKAHPSNPEAYAHLGLLEAHQQHYKPNSSASQSRIPAFMVPSLEAGD